MKYLRIIIRILLGLVFIFSGFVKVVDPMGSYIKFSEYLEAFHLDWLDPVSMVLANVQNIAELLIGIALVIGLKMRVTAWATLLFMSFFLVLTLFIAIKNPVTDCGCFGDAFVISNWQTFYKNIFLITLAIIIFYSRNKYVPYAKPFTEWSLVIFFVLAGTGISVYCYHHLPILDFRPYHIGTHIPSKMITPPDAPIDEYKTILYYEKNGVRKEFTVDHIPDSTWTWKETKSDLIKKGYTPPIHGFSITSQTGEDITRTVLTDTSYSFIFVVQNATKVKSVLWKSMTDYYRFSADHHNKFYILTSSPQTSIDQVKKEYHLPFDFYLTDETTLKTIIRSNPGLMLLKDGVVLGLWHYNDWPQPGYFNGNILSRVLTDEHTSIERKRIFILLLGFMAILVALLGWRKSKS
jgi:uncharacterized membrane protein YphA (DoxX/SURF4 family)